MAHFDEQINRKVKTNQTVAKDAAAANTSNQTIAAINALGKSLAVREITEGERNEATLELLNKLLEKDSSIVVDASSIGTEIAKAISKMKPPVVNVPERKPISYYAKIDRDEKGVMVGSLISPVEKHL